MRLTRSGRPLGELCYCSNIHPGESWAAVRDNLERHVPAVRAALGLAPDARFGIGLRLSGEATATLSDDAALEELRRTLGSIGAYVFTINAFPYGPFHGTRVKEEVYLPDWRDPERLRYTDQVADVLARVLPEGATGSVSTVPGAFKARVAGEADVERMARAMIEHVAHLVRLERASGRAIVLALEPEPCCFLETVAESVDFFANRLHDSRARATLGGLLGVGAVEAERLLRKHLTLCLDLCHAAVEFEDLDDALDALDAAGIAIGKLQISSGLRLERVTAASAERLRPFLDEVYLHQVVERRGRGDARDERGEPHRDDGLVRYADLPDALASLGDDAGEVSREWRVHFHVPIFLDDLGAFASTQPFIARALERHRREPISEHLEVETYTWDVLPERYRAGGIDAAIARELEWVRATLGAD